MSHDPQNDPEPECDRDPLRVGTPEHAEAVRRLRDDWTPQHADENPHEPWPIEPLCCSFHYPVEYADIEDQLTRGGEP